MVLRTIISAGVCALILVSAQLPAQENKDGNYTLKDTKLGFRSERTEYYEDKDGNLRKEVEYDSEGRKKTEIIRDGASITVNRYSEDGRLLQTNNRPDASSNTTVRYDADGTKTVTTYRTTPSITGYSKTVEIFWPNGNIKQRTPYVPTEESIYFFDYHAVSLSLNERDFVIDGVEQIYDENGKLIQENIYEQGRHIKIYQIKTVDANSNGYEKVDVTSSNDYPMINNRTILPGTSPEVSTFVPDWAMIPAGTNSNVPVEEKIVSNNEEETKSDAHENVRENNNTNNTGSHMFLFMVTTPGKTDPNMDNFNKAVQLVEKFKAETNVEKKKKTLIQLEQTLIDIDYSRFDKKQIEKCQNMAVFLSQKQTEYFPQTYFVSEATVRNALNLALGKQSSYEDIEKLMDDLLSQTSKRHAGEYTDAEADAFIKLFYYLVQKSESFKSGEKALRYALNALLIGGGYLVELSAATLVSVNIDRSLLFNHVNRLLGIAIKVAPSSAGKAPLMQELLDKETKNFVQLREMVRKI